MECVLLLWNVSSYYGMCSLTMECVLLRVLDEGGGSEGSGANVPDGGSGAKDGSKAPSGSGAKDGVTSYDEAACLKACGACIKYGDGTDCDRIAYSQCCSK